MDMDRQADEAWILSVQRKLYQWSQENPGDQWRDMWGWLTDIRTLRCAWRRVASNRGARTAGVDGMTVGRIRAKGNEKRFLERLQAELRSGAYRPSPSRRILIPKAGKPGTIPPPGHTHGQGPRRPRRGQNLIGAYLRSAVLACFLRVSARTKQPWRLGVPPPNRPAAQTRSGQAAEPAAISMGYRGRHQELFRPNLAPPPNEPTTRSRGRSSGDAAGRAILESRRTGGRSIPPH